MSEARPRIRAFVSVGSNIDPAVNIPEALARVSEHAPVVGSSTFYRTPAIDRPDDPEFRNGLWQIDAHGGPESLSNLLAGVEIGLGRVRHADHYGPRTIDLDLVMFGTTVSNQPGHVLPHPDLARAFVYGPLWELAADWLKSVPLAFRSAVERAADRPMDRFADASPGEIDAELTGRLREMLAPPPADA